MSSMREVFRVTVTREITDDDLGDTTYITEFEAVGRTGEQLARFAPQEVLAALLPSAAEPVPVDGPTTVTEAEAPKPARKRRTKAEIAADDAAATAAGMGPEVAAETAMGPEQQRAEGLAAQARTPVDMPSPETATAAYNPFA